MAPTTAETDEHRRRVAAATAAAASASGPTSIPHNTTGGKKLHKKHYPNLSRTSSSTAQQQRTTTMELPDRLLGSDDEGGEDLVPPSHHPSQTGGAAGFMNMNQSIFGLIAAAGSTVDFTDRFGEGGSSDDEDAGPSSLPRRGLSVLAQTTVLRKPSTLRSAASGSSSSSRQKQHQHPQTEQQTEQGGQSQKSEKHRRKLSEHKLLRSLPALPRLASRSKSTKASSLASGKSKLEGQREEEEPVESRARPAAAPPVLSLATKSTSTSSTKTKPAPATASSPSIEVTREEGRLAPVMSRMLEARAEMSSRPSFDLERTLGEHAKQSTGKAEDDVDVEAELEELGPSPLARKLMDIFLFDEPEEVVAEYPCWLLQSVLLQGYMYITSKHICFYSYLPRKSHDVAKSGYLSKSGKRNPKYNRYWFRLKGDVLSYYLDPANLYFPSGNIDLRYAISASVTDKERDGLHFSLVTHQRTFSFRADSAPSAKEWVKSLQRVIFRSHNDGDSVKISLPIENVIDLEETQMVEFADTCKIRVIDNDETYAIDEYFFSFFGSGKEALNVLRILIEDSSAAHRAADDNEKLAVPLAQKDTASSDDASSKHSSVSGGRLPLASPTMGGIPERMRSTRLNEHVKATLSPTHAGGPASSINASSPRASGEYTRASIDAIRHLGRRSLDLQKLSREASPRRSFSDSRRSLSRNRLDDRRGGGMRDVSGGAGGMSGSVVLRDKEKQGSTDSYVQSSMEEPSLSALVASSSEDPSASQILRGSDVFHHSPTIGRSFSDHRVPGVRPQAMATTSAAPLETPRSSSKSGLAAYSGQHAATTGHVDDPGAGERPAANNSPSTAGGGAPATPTLQNLTRIGAYPLQRAGAFADYLNKQGRRMSNLLAGAGDAMGYVEKVSGMWKGGRRHYDEPQGLKTDDELEVDAMEDDDKVQDSMERFRAHFALPESERLQATYFGYLMRVLPLYGKIYVSNRSFCFRSLLPGTRTKLILPLRDVETVDKEKGFRFGYSGLVVVIRGHEELFFEFGQPAVRDDCAITVLQMLDAAKYLGDEDYACKEDRDDAETAMAERDALNDARQLLQLQSGSAASTPDREHPPPHLTMQPHLLTNPRRTNPALGAADHPKRMQTAPAALVSRATDSPTTILFDDPRASFLNFKPAKPLRITCLTIGSRGDVQPYIALAKGLLAEGHSVKIATHEEFRSWIEGHGIGFSPVEGDPGELMRICIEYGTFTYTFLKQAQSKFRGWLDELLVSAWDACQDTDLLIESPSAMAGIHIAEALQIPYFRAFTMPWTRTRAYPHAFVVPEHKMGGAYNYITYVMFDNIFWKATAFQVNRWRNAVLGLPNTTLEKMQPNKVPFLYNFSPSVVAPPLDYSDWIRVTGYWFLDEGTATSWTPPKELADFIEKARRDDKKLVYVGFGSIIVPDPAKLTMEIIDAVQRADVRCILSKGWSDRAVVKDESAESDPSASATPQRTGEIPLPDCILQIKSAPHDWLFRQVDAAAHHGGAGTTGASLRAGIPTIVRPFFGDQFFFGQRVEDMGVGIILKKWGASTFARALWEATHSERMVAKARGLGAQIRKENGVDVAIQSIYRDLEYATSLVRAKAGKHHGHATNTTTTTTTNTSSGATASGQTSLVSGNATPTSPPYDYYPDGAGDDSLDASDEDEEESWTFVGGSPEDVELPTAALARERERERDRAGGTYPAPGMATSQLLSARAERLARTQAGRERGASALSGSVILAGEGGEGKATRDGQKKGKGRGVPDGRPQ